MEDIDSREALALLIRLQGLQSQVSHLQAQVGGTPGEIEALDRKIEEDRQQVENAAAEMEHASKERRRLEGEVETLRSKLSHLKGQLMEVKTNEAYQAMLHEISYVEQQISEREDQIIDEMMVAEELQSSLGREKGAFDQRRLEIEAKKKDLQSFLEESSRELEKLRTDAQLLEQEIPNEYLERYRRIAAARGGVALATISDQCCAACHVRLRPQLIAEVRAQSRLVLCESCNRILYHQPSP